MQFVYPADTLGKAIREFTLKTPLDIVQRGPCQPSEVRLQYDLTKISEATQMLIIKQLMRLEFSEYQAHFFADLNGGINITIYNSGEYGHRVGHWQRDMTGPLAFEPIIFGTGVIRPAKVKRTEFERIQDMKAIKRTTSHHKEVYGHVIKEGKKVYECTNLIYGGSYGELEQIRARRDDADFLDTYLGVMDYMMGEVRNPDGSSPRCMAELVKEHMDVHHTWLEQPKSKGELLERVEYLLDNTLVDNDAFLARTEKGGSREMLENILDPLYWERRRAENWRRNEEFPEF